MRNMVALLNGSQSLGRSGLFWTLFWVLVGLLAGIPLYASAYTVSNFSYFLVWTFMAMGLSLMWGHAGILSFGQTAFFGAAGYAYSVLSINMGDAHGLTWVAFVLSIIAPIFVALLLGYLIFYGGIRDVFVGIVTLSVTLVCETFMAQTAGPEWTIGAARLNGFNGMSGMPPLTINRAAGDIVIDGSSFYWLLLVTLVVAYLGLRILVNSRTGNVFVAIRENPERAEMLGYNVRFYQLAAFVIGSFFAGVSGTFYTLWGSYITPSSMGLNAAALPIVWVAAGGRKDITAVLAATMLLVWVSQQLAIYGDQYALILMGALLLIVVLFAPQGFVVSLWQRLGRRTRTS